LIVAGKADQVSDLEWGTQQGCFKKYGLTIKYTLASSNAVAVAGLVSGSFDLIISGPATLIQSIANGSFPMKIVAPRYAYSAEELSRAKQDPLYPGEMLLEAAVIVKKDSPIKSWKDLEKHKVGVPNLQGSTHGGVLMGIRASGGNSSLAEMLVVPAAQGYAALKRGDIDAIALSEPFASQAILDGGRVIGYPGAYFFQSGAAQVYSSSDAIVAKRRDAMLAFQKAILEINRLLNRPENEASRRKIISTVTGVDAATVEKTRLPFLMEKNVTFGEIRYLPKELKDLGFTKSIIALSSILFK
jgi:NitT/TauT family transport system substrate-binding protein